MGLQIHSEKRVSIIIDTITWISIFFTRINVFFIKLGSYYQRYWSQISIAQIEDLNEDFVKILRPCLLYFPRNKPTKSVMVGLGRFIVLNDSASPKMAIQIYLNISRFLLMVLELLECRRGNPYVTVNKNCIRFAHP